MHLEEYELIRVFKIFVTDGNIEYWATNHLDMSDFDRVKYASFAWTIELALPAFLRIESFCFANFISWFEAKTQIIRAAVRVYLANPIYSLTT